MLHDQAARVLSIVESWPDLTDLSPEQARQLDERRRTELGGVGPELRSVEDVELPSPRGPVPARVYRSDADAAGVLLWLHGGGWVVGSPSGVDDQARRLAQASGCVVVSLDYALAPEHKHPCGLHDCVAALEWIHDNPGSLDAPAGRVAIGGDSAGGNLAAAACLMARDRRWPPVDLQALVYPVTCRWLDTPSRRRFADGYWLTLEAMDWFWRCYLRSERQALSPYASPLLARSLADLPPAFVLVAEYDLLRDEGVMYADGLAEDGVEVEVRQYDGMLHGFLACGGVIDAAAEALDEVGQAVSRAVRAGSGTLPADR